MMRTSIGTWMALVTLTVFIRAAAADSIDAFSVQSGDLLAATTWDTLLAPVGPPPVPNYIHNIVSGHNVTADGSAPYTGAGVNVSDGSLTYTASAVHLPSVTAAAGTTVTETTTGEFLLGDFLVAKRGSMELNGNLIITAEGGAYAGLDTVMSGTGTATVNAASGGELFIADLSGFGGVLQFNGSGDAVRYEGPKGSTARIEMNSTGANQLDLNNTGFGGAARNVVFNQPGIIDHQSLYADPRLQSLGRLTANASVTVDVTTRYPVNERRMFFPNGLSGSETITVNGTVSDPTSTASDISRNEFELGQNAEPNGDSHIPTLSYAGTLTANDYINLEFRRHMPGGAVVVNQNALLDIGYDEAEDFPSLRAGELTVNSGGTLEVGYEQLEDGVVGHNPFNLHLTTQRGRSGDLTLVTGSTTTMQISDLTDLPSGMKPYDTISAEGDVSLGGTLELLINPALTAFYNDNNGDPTFAYVPTDGDMFEIVSVVAERLPTDLDGNGSVGSEDIVLWEELDGNSLAAGDYDVTADVDGNGIADILDLTAITNDLGRSGTLNGSISGDFDSMSIVDPMGVLTGFAVTKTVTATSVTLSINAIPSEVTTHYVSPQGSHLAPYATWTTAATTIQAALDVALDGDTVLVTNGVYDTGGAVVHGRMANRIVIPDEVTVRSSNGPGHTFIVGHFSWSDAGVRCAYVGEGARLEGFTLTNGNTRTSGAFFTELSGGGAWCETGAVLSNCTITGNMAHSLGCGGGTYGGTVTHCTIMGNSAHVGGGTYGSTVDNCVISGNWAMDGGGTYGGAVLSSTVSDNQAFDGGGTYDSTLQNCIVYHNAADFRANCAHGNVEHTCTIPDPGGVGNITNDPQFVGLPVANLRLRSTSLCIDAGTNQAWMIGATDLDGYPRIRNGAVDMGAYEYLPYVDIGLRLYDGSSTVRVACDEQDADQSSLPLRIRKGETTYAVFLVEPDHPTASGLIIQTSSGPKALARIPE